MGIMSRSNESSPATLLGVSRTTPGNFAQPNPADVRAAAREQRYINEETAEEHWKFIDSQVFDRVRAHEHNLAAQAESHTEHGRDTIQEAVDTLAALNIEVLRPLSEGAVPTEESAKRFKELQLSAQQARARLAAADHDAAFLAAKAAQPYEDIVKIWEKLTVLRPVIVR